MSKLPSTLIFVLFLWTIGKYASAQSTARLFQRLNIYYPDAPTFVTALLQDQLGFIWLGSTDGLYRFDGYQFKTFRHNRNASALGEYVCSWFTSL